MAARWASSSRRKFRLRRSTSDPPITVTDTLTGHDWRVVGTGWIHLRRRVGSDQSAAGRGEARSSAELVYRAGHREGRGRSHMARRAAQRKGVLFTVSFNRRNGVKGTLSYAIAVADIPSGKHRVIVDDAMYARYASSGHLLYVTANKILMVVPFDQNVHEQSRASRRRSPKVCGWGSSARRISRFQRRGRWSTRLARDRVSGNSCG